MTGRHLVVSVHDVCPRTEVACRAILAALAANGVRRRSLLVIPCDRGAPLADHPRFAAWLRARAAAGDEVVLHGWHHDRSAADPAPVGLAGLASRLLARGGGEFCDLDNAEAAHRIAAGLAMLRSAGLEPQGFVAPAWLYSPGTAAAVRQAGLGYYTTHLRLRRLDGGGDVWSFGISNRPGPLAGDLAGRVVNEMLVAAHTAAPVARLAVHPADAEGRRPLEHTLRLIRRTLRSGRRPCTYGDLLTTGRRP